MYFKYNRGDVFYTQETEYLVYYYVERKNTFYIVNCNVFQTVEHDNMKTCKFLLLTNRKWSLLVKKK
mgnify:CR=1 FL=1